jgi:hypothetical protein
VKHAVFWNIRIQAISVAAKKHFISIFILTYWRRLQEMKQVVIHYRQKSRNAVPQAELPPSFVSRQDPYGGKSTTETLR